jgi:hypothetical protein
MNYEDHVWHGSALEQSWLSEYSRFTDHNLDVFTNNRLISSPSLSCSSALLNT